MEARLNSLERQHEYKTAPDKIDPTYPQDIPWWQKPENPNPYKNIHKQPVWMCPDGPDYQAMAKDLLELVRKSH
jgi:hypothetical protein